MSIITPPPNLLCDGCMQNGMTAIMWAAQQGHDAIVKMLIEKGAALDKIDKVSDLLTHCRCIVDLTSIVTYYHSSSS